MLIHISMCQCNEASSVDINLLNEAMRIVRGRGTNTEAFLLLSSGARSLLITNSPSMDQNKRHRKILAPSAYGIVLDWNTVDDWTEKMKSLFDSCHGLFGDVVQFREDLHAEAWREELRGLWDESRLLKVERMQDATDMLRSNVGHIALAIIRDLRDPKIIWETLMDAYTPNTSLKLRRRFFRAEQGKKEGVDEWVDRVLAMRNELSSHGITICDEDVIIVLMHGLNKLHESLAEWISAGSPNPETLDSAVAFLKGQYPPSPLRLRREFYCGLQERDEDLGEWVDRVIGLRDMLGSSGVEIDDENVIIVLMMGLNYRYEEHRTWIDITPDALVTLDNAVEFLRGRMQ